MLEENFPSVDAAEGPPASGHELAEETRVLSKGDIVAVKRHIRGHTGIAGGEIIARIELGQATPHGKPQEILLISVSDFDNQDYQTLAHMARRHGGHHSDLVLLAHHDGTAPTSGAFINDGKFYNLGREGDIKWFSYPHNEEKPPGWTPFDDNKTISRKQLILTPGQDKVSILSVTENSATKITSEAFSENPFAR